MNLVYRSLLTLFAWPLILGSAAMAQSGLTTTTKPAGAGAPLPTPGAGSGVNQSAGQGRSQQTLGMAMNAAAGAMFFSECDPPNVMPCVLGALSFAQAAMMGKAAGQSGQTYNASLSGLTGDTPTTVSDWTKTLTPEQVNDINKLSDMGFHINKNGTVTDGTGAIFSPQDFASPEAMAAKGISSGSIPGLQALIGSVNREAAQKIQGEAADSSPHVVAMGVDSAGGGGRSTASYDGAENSSFEEYLKKLKNPFGLSAAQKQQLLNGKSVAHGEDVIGVKVDDIFKMVHRRYQEKRAGDEFVEPLAQVSNTAPVPSVVRKK